VLAVSTDQVLLQKNSSLASTEIKELYRKIMKLSMDAK